MKKLFWLILFWLFAVIPTFAQDVCSRYQSQVIGSRGLPLANQNVAVLTQPANTSTQPGSPLATLCTSTTVATGGANPTTTDALGNFFFYAPSGKYTIQIYGLQVGTPFVQPDTNMQCQAGSACTFTGSTIFTDLVRFNKQCLVDGTTYTTVISAYNDTTNCSAIWLPPGYTETVAASWTLNRTGVPISALGDFTLNFGTNTITVTAGTNQVAISGPPANENSLLGTLGGRFAYTGTGTLLTVGSSSADTANFTLQNVTLDLSGAGAAAIGYTCNRCIKYLIRGIQVGTNGGTSIGGILNGTGNFTQGKIDGMSVATTNIGLQLTGTGAAAANNNEIRGLDVRTALGGTNPILLDFEANSGQNNVYITNCNAGIANTTCVNFGGTNNGNFVQTANTAGTGEKDVVFNSTASQNIIQLLFPFQAATFAGTNNHIIDAGGIEVGQAPTCAVTGAGTGATCAVGTNSSNRTGRMIVSTGTTPGTSGTVTLTYAGTAFGTNGTGCSFMLESGSTTLNARATVIGNGTNGTTSFAAAWDNNAVAPTASQASAFAVQYNCGPR